MRKDTDSISTSGAVPSISELAEAVRSLPEIAPASKVSSPPASTRIALPCSAALPLVIVMPSSFTFLPAAILITRREFWPSMDTIPVALSVMSLLMTSALSESDAGWNVPSVRRSVSFVAAAAIAAGKSSNELT